MAHIIIPLHQSKVATILHITTACLADDDNCACMNSMIRASLSEPHIYVKYVILSVCLSVRTFITLQFTNVVLIYGVPLTVDCSFEADFICTVFVSTNTL